MKARQLYRTVLPMIWPLTVASSPKTNLSSKNPPGTRKHAQTRTLANIPAAGTWNPTKRRFGTHLIIRRWVSQRGACRKQFCHQKSPLGTRKNAQTRTLANIPAAGAWNPPKRGLGTHLAIRRRVSQRWACREHICHQKNLLGT